MKHTAKVINLIMVLVLLVSLAVPAFAATSSSAQPTALEGAYAPLKGTTKTSGTSLLVSTVTVGANPDLAILRVTQEYHSGDVTIGTISGSSYRGNNSYTYNGIIPTLAGYPADVAFICYEVYGGTTYAAYAKYSTFYF